MTTGNPDARPHVNPWRDLAETHYQDQGVLGTLARALVTACDMITDPRVWLDVRDNGDVVLVDRYSCTTELIGTHDDPKPARAIVAACMLFMAECHVTDIEIDVSGQGLAVAETLQKLGYDVRRFRRTS